MKTLTAVLFFLIASFSQIYGQGKTYVVNIEGTIDPGLSPYVSRIITEAEANSASALIFKINTFGGRVDAATQIKDAIINSKIQTIAFIDKRAISAGALIALSCNKIAMVPGASIGAATVVDQQGQKQSEKYQSYMRSEMRSTAERTGRRADIAEGMVDEKVIIEGLVDSTKLITLTSLEARKFGIADTIVNNLDELLAAYDLKNLRIERPGTNWAEDFVRFINNPIISSLLIMVGLIGLFVEIKTPGWGIAGTAALIALGLFFGTSYILKLASIIEILIFIAGVVLLLVEIFVIPGFGVAGISGIVLIIAGLFLSLLGEFPTLNPGLIRIAIIQLAGSLLMTFLAILALLKILPKSTTFNKLVLKEEEYAEAGFTSSKTFKQFNGMEGMALTVLRPAGTAVINDERIDVITEGNFIDKGKKIKVIRIEGSKIFVREIENE